MFKAITILITATAGLVASLPQSDSTEFQRDIPSVWTVYKDSRSDAIEAAKKHDLRPGSRARAIAGDNATVVGVDRTGDVEVHENSSGRFKAREIYRYTFRVKESTPEAEQDDSGQRSADAIVQETIERVEAFANLPEDGPKPSDVNRIVSDITGAATDRVRQRVHEIGEDLDYRERFGFGGEPTDSLSPVIKYAFVPVFLDDPSRVNTAEEAARAINETRAPLRARYEIYEPAMYAGVFGEGDAADKIMDDLKNDRLMPTLPESSSTGGSIEFVPRGFDLEAAHRKARIKPDLDWLAWGDQTVASWLDTWNKTAEEGRAWASEMGGEAWSALAEWWKNTDFGTGDSTDSESTEPDRSSQSSVAPQDTAPQQATEYVFRAQVRHYHSPAHGSYRGLFKIESDGRTVPDYPGTLGATKNSSTYEVFFAWPRSEIQPEMLEAIGGYLPDELRGVTSGRQWAVPVFDNSKYNPNWTPRITEMWVTSPQQMVNWEDDGTWKSTDTGFWTVASGDFDEAIQKANARIREWAATK